MRSRECSLATALDSLADGAHVGLGGILGRNRPLDACRSLGRAGRRGLHLYSFLAGSETEILVIAGAVASVRSGFLDPAANASATKAARADGSIVWNEVSEHVFVGGLLAAGAGLPFWPTLGGVGSDVVRTLDLREVTCPYSGRPVLAVPATPLDVAILHVAAATEYGAVLVTEEREFLDDADITLARAARRVIVTTDRIATSDEVAGGRNTVLASFEVDAVVLLARADSTDGVAR